ncbi:hypothetical protein D3C87_766640 [compost metagenome]
MMPSRESPRWPEGSQVAKRTRERETPERSERAFAQQEAALQRMGAQLREANEKIEGIKQRLQAQIAPSKR